MMKFYRRMRLNSDRGFTLVELVVAVSLLGILTAFVFSSFKAITSLQTSSQISYTSSEQAQIFQRNINNDVRDSREIRINGTPGTDLVVSGDVVTFDLSTSSTTSCKTYVVNPTDSTLYYRTSSSYVQFTDATVSSWVKVSKVSQLSNSNGSKIPYFSLSGNNLQYNFANAVSNDNSTKLAQTSINGGATEVFYNPNASSPCFA